jgi:ketosteroid isomerase-like protein
MMTQTESSSSLKESADQIRARHVAAVNAGDLEAAVGIFAPDSVFLPPGQPPLENIPAIRAWFSHVFGQFTIDGFSLEPGPVLEHGDMVLEHGRWKGTFLPKDGSNSLPAGGTYLTVYALQPDGSTRVIRDSFNGLPG